jgi:hypothetical protein
MSNSKLNADAVCPFYKHDITTGLPSITCEGVYGIGNKIIFENKDEKSNHTEKFCTDINGCKNCEIYKLVNSKYERSKQ